MDRLTRPSIHLPTPRIPEAAQEPRIYGDWASSNKTPNAVSSWIMGSERSLRPDTSRGISSARSRLRTGHHTHHQHSSLSLHHRSLQGASGSCFWVDPNSMASFSEHAAPWSSITHPSSPSSSTYRQCNCSAPPNMDSPFKNQAAAI